MQKQPQKSSLKSLSSAPKIALWPPNLIGYVRLILILCSWKYALSDPQTFTCLYATSYLLDAVDGNIARLLGQTSHYGQQLDILVDRFSTSTLLFVVLKLGLFNIQDEFDRMKHAFFFCSLFLIDFISHWFLVYSNYLVGNKSHNENEINIIARIYYSSPLVTGFICFLAELYVFQFYMGFFPNDLLKLRSLSVLPILLKMSAIGCLYKNIVNFLQFYSSSLRIISLDVEQKNKKQ